MLSQTWEAFLVLQIHLLNVHFYLLFPVSIIGTLALYVCSNPDIITVFNLAHTLSLINECSLIFFQSGISNLMNETLTV